MSIKFLQCANCTKDCTENFLIYKGLEFCSGKCTEKFQSEDSFVPQPEDSPGHD